MIDAHKGGCWLWSGQQNRAKDLAALDSAAPRLFRRTERLGFFMRYEKRAHLTDADKEFIRVGLRMADPLREVQMRRAQQERASGTAVEKA